MHNFYVFNTYFRQLNAVCYTNAVRKADLRSDLVPSI